MAHIGNVPPVSMSGCRPITCVIRHVGRVDLSTAHVVQRRDALRLIVRATRRWEFRSGMQSSSVIVAGISMRKGMLVGMRLALMGLRIVLTSMVSMFLIELLLAKLNIG